MSDSPHTMRQLPATGATWPRRRWWIFLAGLGIFAFLVGVGLSHHLATVSVAPLLEQANQIADPKDRVVAIKDISHYQVDNQIKIWTGLVQAVGAVVLAVGGYFTWRNLLVAQGNLRATQQKLDIDQDGQFTNRFTQAITQLGAAQNGKDQLEVRLGGIYALERISHDSPRDHGTVMAVLTDYVRQNAPWPPREATEPALATGTEVAERSSHKPRSDIQAILTVLGRRAHHEDRPEVGLLDLSFTDLRGADLVKAHLEGVRLSGAHLERAHLDEAHLERAHFDAAHLEGASLLGGHLKGAVLTKANLDGAGLDGAHLEGANLVGAQLDGARLNKVHLEGAHLDGAHLERAELDEAHLEGAFFLSAHLEGARLSEAHLNGTLFLWANLEDANLNKANLEGAALIGARLKGASFHGASLKDARLEHVNLVEARGLTREQIQSAYEAGKSALLPPALAAELAADSKSPMVVDQAPE